MRPLTVTEPQREISIDSSYDVAVVGGGIAGVAAALAATRQHKKVVLIERFCGLGGLATLGNVVKYLPICDGMGNKVCGGLAEELLHLSVRDTPISVPEAYIRVVPECWMNEDDVESRLKLRYMSDFNPNSFQIEMEHQLTKEHVTIMYDTRLCDVIKDHNKITHLIVENKSGRLAIEVKSVVDASGDADVCDRAGCETQNSPNNVLAGWFYELKTTGLHLRCFSNKYDHEHLADNAEGPLFSGIDHRDVSQHVLQTRALMRNKLHELRAKYPEELYYPIAMASMPDFRVTRRLKNQFDLTNDHMFTWVDDCVGLTGDWRKKGPVYPIPLRSIQSDMVPNLFVAGRCISADHTIVDVTRAIPGCAVSGEAAGVAASMFHSIGSIDLPALQSSLRAEGAIIDPKLLDVEHLGQVTAFVSRSKVGGL